VVPGLHFFRPTQRNLFFSRPAVDLGLPRDSGSYPAPSSKTATSLFLLAPFLVFFPPTAFLMSSWTPVQWTFFSQGPTFEDCFPASLISDPSFFLIGGDNEFNSFPVLALVFWPAGIPRCDKLRFREGLGGLPPRHLHLSHPFSLAEG